MTKKYNAAIMKVFEHMPMRIRALPVSDDGYPVPWFVSKIDGKWNFVGIEPGKPMEAHRRKICWVCGQPLGTYKTFVIGPMCAINTVTSEPPVHLACGEFSAKSCPFLSRPRMSRNYKTMPQEQRNFVPGIPIDRNPGVALVWTTRSYEIMKLKNGNLFQIGPPISTSWWCEGRKATRAEIDHSIETGLPHLQKMAKLDGPEAVAELERRIEAAQAYLPEAEPV